MAKSTKSMTLGDLGKKLSNLKTNQILYVALLIAVFFLGYLFAKVQMLEGGTSRNLPPTTGAPAQAQQSALTMDEVKSWASDLGMNSDQFTSCLDSNQYQSDIDADVSAGQTAGVSGTPTTYINGVQIVGAQPFETFKAIIDQELTGTPSQEARVDVEVGHLPGLGDDSAPVTMVEFSDLECPFCNAFFSGAFQQIKSEYIDTGKVKFYFRHFPLDFHPLAKPFANAVECANEQGKFWELHDMIYEAQ